MTARAMERAMHGLLAVAILVITLAPFGFVGAPDWTLTTFVTGSDLVLNTLMFVPFGLLHHSADRRRGRGAVLRTMGVGFAFSVAIESAQLFLPTRYTSPFDVLTNTLGAGLGAMLAEPLHRRPAVGTGAIQRLALDLPLSGLLLLLLPLGWTSALASVALGWSDRAWLLLLPAIAGGLVLGGLTTDTAGATMARGDGGGQAADPAVGRRSPVRPALLVAAWAMLLLAAVGRPAPVAFGLFAAWGGAAVGHLIASGRRRRGPGAERRVEGPLLLAAVPPIAVWVVLTLLWPLDPAPASWRFGFPIAPTMPLSQGRVFLILEQLLAFVVLGYAIAEYRGRAARRTASPAGWGVSGWCTALTAAALVEMARALHPQHAGSAAIALLAAAGAAFGAALYARQRAHVRAVIASTARADNVSSARADVMAAAGADIASAARVDITTVAHADVTAAPRAARLPA